MSLKQNDIFEESKKEAEEEWLELTPERAKSLIGKKIHLQATKQIDWYTGLIEGIFKVWQDSDGNIWLMKPRATRKGYILSTLKKSRYILIQ